MAFKTGGFKTKYIEAYGYVHNEYTIYCAVESVSDVCRYVMVDEHGKELEICIAAEDDTEANGCYSLIDCLFYLKRQENKIYDNHMDDIIIEQMTDEEMKLIFNA